MAMCLYFVSFGNMYVFVQDCDHDFESFFSMLIDLRLLVFYVQLEALKIVIFTWLKGYKF